jgi:AcrR family transcriptional regulator
LGQSHGAVVTAARERLLSEAFLLFYSTGIRAVGIDLVIARAGVAKATFYRHFPSKAELVAAYVQRRHDAWLAWLREDVGDRGGNGTAPLLAIFDALAEWFADPAYRGCAVINAVAEVGESAPGMLVQARRHKAELRDYVAGLAGDASLPAPDEVAAQVVVLIDGAIVAAQRERNADASRVARGTCELIVSTNGSGPTKKRPRPAKK